MEYKVSRSNSGTLIFFLNLFLYHKATKTHLLNICLPKRTKTQEIFGHSQYWEGTNICQIKHHIKNHFFKRQWTFSCSTHILSDIQLSQSRVFFVESNTWQSLCVVWLRQQANCEGQVVLYDPQ